MVPLRSAIRTRLPAVCALLLAGHAARADSIGWGAYDAGRYDQAIAAWRAAAAQGDAMAAFGLAQSYERGQGVAADDGQACLWYGRAGESGVREAEFRIAAMTDAGRCGDRRPELAAMWYGRAAAAGHGQAQYALARLYEDGDGLPRNTAAAIVWYQAAAANAVPAAAARIKDLRGAAPVTASGPLVAAIPSVPAGAVTLPQPGLPVEVAFVWQATQQPVAAEFYIEVADLHDTVPHIAYAAYTPRSAVLVALPAQAAQYAWRVFTVSRAPRDYVSSRWVEFHTTAARR